MNLRTRMIAAIGAVMLGISMLAGIAAAGNTSEDSMQTSVDVSCSDAATVTLGGNGTFAPIKDSTKQNNTQTGQGAIKVTVDMGCYWGPWTVNAQTTHFKAGPGKYINANHFSLRDATVETYFLEGVDFLGVLEPSANDAYFYGSSDQDAILETSENWFWFIKLPDSPAPFVTTASYTGFLDDLPSGIPSGNYKATLTVELTLE